MNPIKILFLVGLAIFLLSLDVGAQSSQLPNENQIRLEEKKLVDLLEPAYKKMLSDQFVDLVVNVRYVPTSDVVWQNKNQHERIKLPGFESYINVSKGGGKGVSVIGRTTRYRTVMLLVNQTLPSSAERSVTNYAIKEGDLNLQGEDIFKVVVVTAEAGKAMSQTTESPEMARDKKSKPVVPVDSQLEAQSALHLLQARQAFFNNDLNLALTQVVESINISPNSAQPYEMLGSIYYRLNWKMLAIKNWEKSLQLNPNNDKLKKYLDRVRNMP